VPLQLHRWQVRVSWLLHRAMLNAFHKWVESRHASRRYRLSRGRERTTGEHMIPVGTHRGSRHICASEAFCISSRTIQKEHRGATFPATSHSHAVRPRDGANLRRWNPPANIGPGAAGQRATFRRNAVSAAREPQTMPCSRERARAKRDAESRWISSCAAIRARVAVVMAIS